ncbi:hypothetical protein HN51_015588, partial [Arachis hypogaea]
MFNTQERGDPAADQRVTTTQGRGDAATKQASDITQGRGGAGGPTCHHHAGA